MLTVLLMRSTIGVYVIPSASMEATLHGCAGCENDRVLVDKVSLWVSPLRPGEVVVFHGPDGWLGEAGVPAATGLVAVLEQVGAVVGITPPGSADFVKRVVAIGGQTVQCCDSQGRVVVDGSPLEEPYVRLDPRTGQGQQAAFGPVRVPDDHLWVMGDNRNNSADSRFRGPIPVAEVVGRARLIVWPVFRWDVIPAPDLRVDRA